MERSMISQICLRKLMWMLHQYSHAWLATYWLMQLPTLVSNLFSDFPNLVSVRSSPVPTESWCKGVFRSAGMLPKVESRHTPLFCTFLPVSFPLSFHWIFSFEDLFYIVSRDFPPIVRCSERLEALRTRTYGSMPADRRTPLHYDSDNGIVAPHMSKAPPENLPIL